MSENEEKDRHKAATEPTVIVVNQQSSADNRMSYPLDLQDESNKRSKIPSIPSVAADLKEASTAQHIEVDKQESSERNTQAPVATVLSKHQASAMLSSNQHVPEILKPFDTIVLGTMESEPVLKVIPSEPIPLDIKPTKSRGSLRSGKSAGDVSEEEDISVLPTREATRLSDWETDYATKKKQISWSDPEYLEVQLQRSMTDFSTAAKTGINIVISKGSLIESKRHPIIPQMIDVDEMLPTSQSHEQISPNCASPLREKLDMMRNKIKHYFNR